MSILETPRILFRGAIAWDPITTNNDPANYDEDTDEPVWPSAPDKVQAFRQAAIDAVVSGGNWNPHGTHRSTFFDTTISGVDLGTGAITSDPFVAAAVNFRGMLVDLEPYGGYTSQLFFDAVQFGIDGGYRIVGKRSARFTARYINFRRNPSIGMIAGGASVIWQTSLAKTDGLRIDPFDSPALQALEAALQAPDVLGLTVRFNTYHTIYFDNATLKNQSPATKQAAAELLAKLQTGGFQPNPARSTLLGVIGLWRKGEPRQEPGDRALLAPSGAPLASAHARLGATSLTIDLSNSVRETGPDLQKADLGTLTVVAVNSGGPPTPLGTIPYAQYDRQAYEAQSGIVSLPLTAAQVKEATDSDLQIVDLQGNVLLTETALRAVPIVPNLYIDQGATHTASFQVYERGVPAKSALPVTVFTINAAGNTESTANLQTDANGVLAFPVTGATGRIFGYAPALTPGTSPPAGGIDPQVNTYMYVRILAADANIGALPPTWDNVYGRVLANWNAMAPCMDNWLKLDDPVQVRAQAALLKRLTDPANFESFLFMPVTRDMTRGGRDLLYKFLDTPVVAQVTESLSVTEKSPPTFAEQSRALR